MIKVFIYLNFFRYSWGSIIALFGFSNFILGSAVAFDISEVREQIGNYVMFVIIANIIIGIIYLFAAYGFFHLLNWTTSMFISASIILFITLIAFMIYRSYCGNYESRTVYALTSKIILTLLFFASSYSILQRKINKKICILS